MTPNLQYVFNYLSFLEKAALFFFFLFFGRTDVEAEKAALFFMPFPQGLKT